MLVMYATGFGHTACHTEDSNTTYDKGRNVSLVWHFHCYSFKKTYRPGNKSTTRLQICLHAFRQRV